ncbi:MAG: hypothetical protein RI953_2834 [Pseudomonadota bacterium]|jgi:hypothetical protein
MLLQGCARGIGVGLDSGMMSAGELNREQVIRAGLNFDRVQSHQERILSVLTSGRETTLPIVGACTTSNGAVIPWKTLVRFAEGERLTAAQRRARRAAFHYWCRQHLGTFIPAAGAASRFMASLERFIQDVNQQVPEIGECCRRWYRQESGAENIANRSKRLDSLAALAAMPLNSDIKVIPQLLGDWNKTDIFHEFDLLSRSLELYFTEGRESETLGNPAHVTHAHEQGHENLLDNSHWRIHWESEGSLGNRISGDKNSHRDVHWLDALQSQPPAEAKSQGKRLRRDLTEKERLSLRCYSAAFTLIERYRGHPKALVPTTGEGDSFLFLKLIEQIALLPSSISVYVAPFRQTPSFKSEIDSGRHKIIRQAQNVFDLAGTQFAPDWLKPSTQNHPAQSTVLEQGLELCTLRFNEDGTPVMNEDGSYSSVAAGHGELLNLFPDIAAQWPNIECLHIRNIDNVIGTQQERQQELSAVAETFRLLRDTLEFLRAEVEDFLPHCRTSDNNDKLKSAQVVTALKFLSQLIPGSAENQILPANVEAEARVNGLTVETFQRVLGNLFHWQPLPEKLSLFAKWDWLQQQLSRPLSVFGVVRKEVGDVGGGPVFAQLPDGTHVKICLEMPHASKEDAQEYFGNKGRATHFNPVLVFFELRTHQRSHTANPRSGRIVQPGQLFDEHFWLLARKEFVGRKVCYHETVLYELIGNSARTNVLFVEVPRTLFRPHKTLLDSLGQDRRSYGFDETLKGED